MENEKVNAKAYYVEDENGDRYPQFAVVTEDLNDTLEGLIDECEKQGYEDTASGLYELAQNLREDEREN